MRKGVLIASLMAAALYAGCGDDGGGGSAAQPEGTRGPALEDPGPVHVHGLGINPADGALFVATHTGLFRAAPGEERSKRVGDRFQDTMGFTVVAPDRFLGSGHPDLRDKLPPFLGLIRSTNAGRSWRPISLLGKRDFHALEAAGERVYGYGSDYKTRGQGLLVSDDGGRHWRSAEVPEPFLALAADPEDPKRVAASGARGVYLSEDGAASWQQVHTEGGLVAWSEAGLILVSARGLVSTADEEGAGWRRVGTVGGQPAALEAAQEEVYVALHDGRILRSEDGADWELRARP